MDAGCVLERVGLVFGDVGAEIDCEGSALELLLLPTLEIGDYHYHHRP